MKNLNDEDWADKPHETNDGYKAEEGEGEMNQHLDELLSIEGKVDEVEGVENDESPTSVGITKTIEIVEIELRKGCNLKILKKRL